MLLLHLWLTLLSFLLFHDAPSASLPIHRSSSVSSTESPPVVPDYAVKPPVTQFYSCRGARLLDALAFSDELSSDVSSSFIEDVPFFFLLLSLPLQSSLFVIVTAFAGLTRLRLSQPLLLLSQFLLMMLFFIQSGSARWLRRLLLLSGLACGILCHVPHVFVRPLVNRSIRLRLALIVLLSVIRLVLLLVVFSRSKVVIMMRHLLLLLI
jgi:hypothetical protein